MISVMYTRRWKGWKRKEVVERMKDVASYRFNGKTKAERLAFSRAGVEARGSWQIVEGERKFIRKVK